MIRRLALLAAPLALAISSLGCGSDSNGPREIRPAQLFTGHDPDGTRFVVPATFYGSTNVSWSVADKSLATLEPDPIDAKAKNHVIVVGKGAGKTKLIATVDGEQFSVDLTIHEYASGAKAEGDDLYQIDRASEGSTGGEQQFTGLGCISCHGVGGDAKHSPSEIGGYDDPALLTTIRTAVRPGGGLANGGAHKFDLQPEQEQAILARLRSLEPETWP